MRPCGLPHRSRIEAMLREAGLVPARAVAVERWEHLARDLYRPTFGVVGSRRLSPGAEAWLTATRLLFGDSAVLLLFGEQADDAATRRYLERLDQSKKAFRDTQRSVREHLSVGCLYEDVTYPVVFNYLHSPEPDMTYLAADWQCLVGHLSNKTQ